MSLDQDTLETKMLLKHGANMSDFKNHSKGKMEVIETHEQIGIEEKILSLTS